MSTGKHLEATLQRDIDLIRRKVMDMAGLVEGALKKAWRALTEQSRQLAYGVILRDQQIDELEKEIDRLCLEFLVRQQPVAGHLRFAYATIKINAELERIGDYAESIAKQVLRLASIPYEFSPAEFFPIAELSIPMVGASVRAFVQQDAHLARTTMEVENQVNTLRSDLTAKLMRAEKEGRIPLEALTPLTMVARRFERVSDQAKNICEEVLYMCTGEYMKHKGTEVLRILFLDEHNSCRSVMAEAIGTALGEPTLVFASAGLEPRPLDPETKRFLATRGIDLSRQAPRTLDQIPNLEHYQVIIALDEEARKALPQPPTKTVALEWIVEDPSQVRGTPEQINAAYKDVFQTLSRHIDDLTEAILDD